MHGRFDNTLDSVMAGPKTGAITESKLLYQLPTFSILAQGSRAGSASPFCSNSMEIPSGVLMNAIEFFRPFDVLIPRKILGRKAKTQKRLNRLYRLPELSLGV